MDIRRVKVFIIVLCCILTVGCASQKEIVLETHSEEITELPPDEIRQPHDTEPSFQEQIPANNSAEASALFENIVGDEAYIWDWEGNCSKYYYWGNGSGENTEAFLGCQWFRTEAGDMLEDNFVSIGQDDDNRFVFSINTSDVFVIQNGKLAYHYEVIGDDIYDTLGQRQYEDVLPSYMSNMDNVELPDIYDTEDELVHAYAEEYFRYLCDLPESNRFKLDGYHIDELEIDLEYDSEQALSAPQITFYIEYGVLPHYEGSYAAELGIDENGYYLLAGYCTLIFSDNVWTGSGIGMG